MSEIDNIFWIHHDAGTHTIHKPHTPINPHTQHIPNLSILTRKLVGGGPDPGAQLAQLVMQMPNGDAIARSFAKNYILKTG